MDLMGNIFNSSTKRIMINQNRHNVTKKTYKSHGSYRIEKSCCNPLTRHISVLVYLITGDVWRRRLMGTLKTGGRGFWGTRPGIYKTPRRRCLGVVPALLCGTLPERWHDRNTLSHLLWFYCGTLT
jgi:hypothetical protein